MHSYILGSKNKRGTESEKRNSSQYHALYIKAGSIIPFGPKVQYANEKKWDNLEISIYEGANGSFTLYEDENDNYNYEKGGYSLIPFSWDNAKRALTVGDRTGSFPGMINERNFKIVLVTGNKETESALKGIYEKVMSYSGEKIIVKF